jgi:hypothetical protein
MASLKECQNIHRLKLVTGVEISTRPVRTGGNEGKAVNSSRRIATAEPNRRAFCLSMAGKAYYCIMDNIVAYVNINDSGRDFYFEFDLDPDIDPDLDLDLEIINITYTLHQNT